MSQALFTSMTGLNVAQQSINVVSNNVANINTTAYKSADARFATLFSNTLSAGNAPSETVGGTNPKQIGLGVKLSAIARNFNTGSFLSTDRNSDSMIQGSGYYTVMNASGGIYYTRDGGFSLDANGNMITASGLKVLGASSLRSQESSSSPIRVPQNFSRVLAGDADLKDRQLSELNNASFTTGTLSVTVTDGTGTSPVTKTVSITIGDAGSGADVEIDGTTKFDTFMQGVASKLNTAISAESGWTTTPTLTATTNDDGTVTWKMNNDDITLQIEEHTTTNIADELNFFKVTGTSGTTSDIISYTVDVNPTTSATNMTGLQSYTIGPDGSIEATYDNGDKLTVYLDNSNTFQFRYITSTGVYIDGDKTATTPPSPVKVNPLLCTEESMVIQLASITNEAGMLSQADNLWSAGPDSGPITYTIAGQMGTGSLLAGGLESSNVDLARELSNMIVAQRAINANSHVFGTASEVLEILSQLGR